jgi:glycosyltransferase involved in cell wall biosynthesis
LRGNFDVVIDEVNTIPFFTPLWSEIPSFMFIHQLAREVWWYESPFPMSGVGYLAEPVYLRLYRHTPVMTVSQSTCDDLRALGFSGTISIVPEGVEAMSQPKSTKQITPTFLYLGRLAPSKRVDEIIRAFAAFHGASKSAQLWLVGDGPPSYVARLRDIVNTAKLTEAVRFWGRVDIPTKHRLMGESHALLMASVREGWGLVVTEANSCGTPAIAYNVPGLRDSVRHEETGLLVEPRPWAMASAMLRLFNEPVLYGHLVQRARSHAMNFSFDESARIVEECLSGVGRPAHIAAGG